MELILLFATIFYAKKYFTIYKCLYEFFVLKIVLVVIIYFIYQYFFAQSNGILPSFNDQFLYLNISKTDYDIRVLLKSIFLLSFRSTNMSFLALVYIQIVYYISQIIEHKRNSHKKTI